MDYFRISQCAGQDVQAFFVIRHAYKKGLTDPFGIELFCGFGSSQPSRPCIKGNRMTLSTKLRQHE
ncbi:MAG: hypothetical protein ABIK28_09075 [Planctomycetota bacterium]